MGSELFDISGRTALVTGGVRGVGLMIARGLVSAGATVYITSRSACDEVAAELAELPGGGTCVGLVADLSTEAGCAELAATAAEREDHLDILVNNAGVLGDVGMGNLTQQVWQDVLAVNVQAAFFLVRDLLPLLRAGSVDGEPSRVINVGAADGSITSDLEHFAYSSSKAALHHLTSHLARTLAPELTVNAVAPGICDTRMTEDVIRHFGASVSTQVPMKRICGPDDLVSAVMFLASRAGAYVTGTVIPLDGGVSTS
jgi:NAD(P)-dependent dehydrogenase (short-subunit alcohol dehydrogenase family)